MGGGGTARCGGMGDGPGLFKIAPLGRSGQKTGRTE
jgi:hypothetical protein